MAGWMRVGETCVPHFGSSKQSENLYINKAMKLRRQTVTWHEFDVGRGDVQFFRVHGWTPQSNKAGATYPRMYGNKLSVLLYPLVFRQSIWAPCQAIVAIWASTSWAPLYFHWRLLAVSLVLILPRNSLGFVSLAPIMATAPPNEDYSGILQWSFLCHRHSPKPCRAKFCSIRKIVNSTPTIAPYCRVWKHPKLQHHHQTLNPEQGATAFELGVTVPSCRVWTHTKP